MNIRLICVLMLWVGTSTHASEPKSGDCIENALHDTLEATRSLNARRIAEISNDAPCKSAPEQWRAHYLHGYIDYRLAEVLMLTDDEKSSDRALVRAVEHFESAIESQQDCAVCYAMLSSAQGMRIGLKPRRGMFLGRRAARNMSTAAELDGDDPAVVLLRAGRRLHTPSMFGGDIDRANALYARALEHFDQTPWRMGWDAAGAYYRAAVGLRRADRVEEAEQHLRTAIELDPRFELARNALDELVGAGEGL